MGHTYPGLDLRQAGNAVAMSAAPCASWRAEQLECKLHSPGAQPAVQGDQQEGRTAPPAGHVPLA